ncbi:hypothetical protein GCM10023069_57170 [Shinella granuli]
MLAAQAVGDEGSEATDNEAFGVDEDPLLFYLGGLLYEGCHGRCLSFAIPKLWGDGRFLLLGLAPCGCQKSNAARGDRDLERLISESRWDVKRRDPKGVKDNIAKTMCY